jgi:hypothetical protein
VRCVSPSVHGVLRLLSNPEVIRFPFGFARDSGGITNVCRRLPNITGFTLAQRTLGTAGARTFLMMMNEGKGSIGNAPLYAGVTFLSGLPFALLQRASGR